MTLMVINLKEKKGTLEQEIGISQIFVRIAQLTIFFIISRMVHSLIFRPVMFYMCVI